MTKIRQGKNNCVYNITLTGSHAAYLLLLLLACLVLLLGPTPHHVHNGLRLGFKSRHGLSDTTQISLCKKTSQCYSQPINSTFSMSSLWLPYKYMGFIILACSVSSVLLRGYCKLRNHAKTYHHNWHPKPLTVAPPF